jgi:pyruvate,water dikinase
MSFVMSPTTAVDTRYTWTPDAGSDPPELGGKAASLRALTDAGFPVPACFAVAPSACRDSLSASQREALKAGRLTAADLDDLAPASAVREAITDQMRQTFGDESDLLVAVRSSAPEEDAAEHSFAGQLESYLFVPPEEVPGRVAEVWRSAFQESVLEYRRAQGLDGLPSPPAVVVQRMVPPDRAGVAFSAEPSTGRRGRCVVAAVQGAGTALVDGTEDGDTFHVDREGQVVDQTIRRQHTAHRLDRDAASGLRETTLIEENGTPPALSDEEAAEVASLARRAECHFGRPQDIEWARADGTLYLLQARPITKLAGEPDPDAPLRVWDNSNIAESYSGVTTPLTFTFARKAYEAVYQSFLRVMRVPEATIEAHADTFRTMIGLIRGRIYYNLLSWYQTLALLPGFRFNRAFMEDMMGVSERLPEELLPEREAASLGEKIGDALRLVWSALHLILYHFRIDDRIEDFYDLLDRTLDPPAPGLEQMRLDELADYYRTLEEELLARWDVPIANDFFAMIFFGLSKRAVERWGGPAADRHNHLLSGHGAVVSTEPARRMREMAKEATGDRGLTDTLLEGSLREIEAAIGDRPALRVQYEEYLDRFSDRCLDELKLESPTLRDDPLSLWRSVGALARRLRTEDLPEPGTTEKKMREEAEEALNEALSGQPIRRWLTEWTLHHARERIAARENLRFDRTRAFGVARRIFLEMGHRLAANDRLDSPRDVFYLERSELLGVVEGTASTTNLQALVEARRNEFDEYHAAPPPPDRFRTRGAVHAYDLIPAPTGEPDDPDAATADNEWKGIGCCPGTVRGPVRVVTDPREATLEPDEILIAKRTDPGWVTLFATAKGLIVEHGSLLSHAAIVSREMGLPSVVSVPGITDVLQDGDVVEIDGQAGTIRRIDD